MRSWQAVAAGMLLAALGLWAYYPGLAGGFVFDDFVNLNALGRYGATRDIEGVLRYLTSGVADPTGRPVAMLSFLADAQDWPADPRPFKWHNLCLHISNGVLLALLLRRLATQAGWAPALAAQAAWLAAALWMLHPLWVSTTLYVVQRHAMLASFFVLLGLHAWLQARASAIVGSARSALWWALAAVPLCGLLAVLSKPNGALLPVLAVVLEATLLVNSPQPAALVRLRRWTVYLPAILVLVSLLAYGWLTGDGYARRDFTLGQRLLTQPRVLADYLGVLGLPGPQSGSVFADGYVASSGWLHPWTTLPCVVGLFSAVFLAVWGRRRWPLASAAVLFFVAGHLVESGVLPLELYFEHRNYLPSMLLFWWAARALLGLPLGSWIRVLATGAVVTTLAAVTHQQARLWGEPLALAFHWAQARADSPRAQAHWAGLAMAAGQAPLVDQRLAPFVERQPYELQLSLSRLDAQCMQRRVLPDSFDTVMRGFELVGPGDSLVHRWLAGLLRPGTPAACKWLPMERKHALLMAALAGPQWTPLAVSREASLTGAYALASGQCGVAVEAAGRQVRAMPRPEHLLESSLLLTQSCPASVVLPQLRRSREVLFTQPWAAGAGMPRLRDWLMQREGYWEGVFDELEHNLAGAVAQEGVGTTVPVADDKNGEEM